MGRTIYGETSCMDQMELIEAHLPSAAPARYNLTCQGCRSGLSAGRNLT